MAGLLIFQIFTPILAAVIGPSMLADPQAQLTASRFPSYSILTFTGRYYPNAIFHRIQVVGL